MINLDEKCAKENYHQTIKFYYHLLPADQKLQFIYNVANRNILLAAQCLMSDTKNDLIENQIKEIAITNAQSFADQNRSIQGLLSLAEFELYDRILFIFNSIEKLNNLQINVLSQVFYKADEKTYLKFIDTFSNSKNIGKLHQAFLSYKGQISISENSIIIINNFIKKLIEQNCHGFIKLYFDSYGLWDQVEIFLGQDLEPIIEGLIQKSTYKSLRLAFHLVQHTNKESNFNYDLLIEKVLTLKHKNRKNIALAIEIAYKNSIYHNRALIYRLKTILSQSHTEKVLLNYLRYFRRNGLMDYIINIPELKNEVDSISNEVKYPMNEFVKKSFDRTNQTKQKINSINPIIGQVSKSYQDEISALIKIFGDSVSLQQLMETTPLIDFWRIIFDYILSARRKVLLEDIIIESSILYSVDFRTICNCLKQFNQLGQVRYKKEYGYYIYPKTFSSAQLCFLHSSLDGTDSSNTDKKELEIDQELEFRIVGFNENTKRINIYLNPI